MQAVRHKMRQAVQYPAAKMPSKGQEYVGMGGDDWLIIYGGSGLFVLIRLIQRAEC